MRQALELARRAGGSDARVLITGESGAGKGLIAREIHEASSRRDRPYLSVGCAGVPEPQLESELFGSGGPSGAGSGQAGSLEQAHRGTLLLDEVGEMNLAAQARLLRFADRGALPSVDASRQPLDVRIISATTRNLPERAAAGEFRQDLLYRLSGIQIAVPPLRERRDDIPVLVAHLLGLSPRPLTCSPEAMDVLLRYSWPGNVRELQNVIEQAIWLATGPTIAVSDLPEALRRTNERDMAALRERRRQVADQLFDALTAHQVLVLGGRLSAVHRARSDAARYPRTGATGTQPHQWQLPRAGDAVRHEPDRLLPVPQLPDRARLQDRLSDLPAGRRRRFQAAAGASAEAVTARYSSLPSPERIRRSMRRSLRIRLDARRWAPSCASL